MTDRESIARGVASAVRDFGAIDVVVNNAGVYTTKPLEVAGDDEIARIPSMKFQIPASPSSTAAKTTQPTPFVSS